jgi:hypothetical protein
MLLVAVEVCSRYPCYRPLCSSAQTLPDRLTLLDFRAIRFSLYYRRSCSSRPCDESFTDTPPAPCKNRARPCPRVRHQLTWLPWIRRLCPRVLGWQHQIHVPKDRNRLLVPNLSLTLSSRRCFPLSPFQPESPPPQRALGLRLRVAQDGRSPVKKGAARIGEPSLQAHHHCDWSLRGAKLLALDHLTLLEIDKTRLVVCDCGLSTWRSLKP